MAGVMRGWEDAPDVGHGRCRCGAPAVPHSSPSLGILVCVASAWGVVACGRAERRALGGLTWEQERWGSQRSAAEVAMARRCYRAALRSGHGVSFYRDGC